MNNGKHICKKLKTIRKQIAVANDIEYEPNVCTHKGDCAGTCPACEAETKYIESQLIKRRKLGKAVSVIGISTSLALGVAAGGLSSCKSTPNGMFGKDVIRGKMPAEKVEKKSHVLDGDVERVPEGYMPNPNAKVNPDSAKSSSPDSTSKKTYLVTKEEMESLKK